MSRFVFLLLCCCIPVIYAEINYSWDDNKVEVVVYGEHVAGDQLVDHFYVRRDPQQTKKGIVVYNWPEATFNTNQAKVSRVQIRFFNNKGEVKSFFGAHGKNFVSFYLKYPMDQRIELDIRVYGTPI